MHPQLTNPKFYLVLFGDAVIFALAHIAAYLFRFEFSLASLSLQQIKAVLLWLVPLKLVVFFSFGLYRGMWRYTSIRDFWLIAQATVVSSLLATVIMIYLNRFEGYSRAVFIIDGVLTFLLIGGLRMVIRSYYSFYAISGAEPYSLSKIHFKKVLIVGAGDAGEKILREIMENNQLHYKVIGFIDDDPVKKGRSIHGIPVIGNVDNMASFPEKEDIQEILIAIPSATGDQIRHVVEACQKCAVSYKIVPGIGELIDGRVSVKTLRDISYEDLLGRPPVRLNVAGIRNYLDGKTILITGCGGSIGAELCRQVVKYQPYSIILLDAGEANLFNIQMELQNEKYCRRCEAILGQVQDRQLMEDIFLKYKPQVVFHAAAYKHVPMLEKNPWEAVFNNIVGSRMVMEMSLRYHVERFVLVSTDKAVRPTNVMGASKRVTELIMQSLQGNGTKFMAVRFGNVVGSSGSVIPLFRRQIERGGPVTVTHPEVNRFFMTIPEASQLILQAGAMGEGGEIFVLEMGTPVKIADMARDLIRLSGKEPEVDIKIVFTGLREGEKLYEELVTLDEDILPTGHEKVMVLRAGNHSDDSGYLFEARNKLCKAIDDLAKDAESHNTKRIKQKLKEIVPEYTPQENEAVL
ncbi:MAG: polysaccharide biosynthesis protein [Deltaproteobacteria bacterium HGW-Deltaproteobacteria-12]|nr:MAG: polysaccharide biosynthesis protein [Deltaproteobacteria bacterium HGW-Deltaproteobacteria-12]